MSILLTYWEDPRIKHTEDDFDEICTIRIKTIQEIPSLITAKHPKCTMISTEHSSDRRKRNGEIINSLNPRCFIERWRKGQSIPESMNKHCPLCGCSIHGTSN